MILGITRETYPGERRVALTPSLILQMIKAGIQVVVETEAGDSAGFLDSAYEEQGAEIVGTRTEVFKRADILFFVRALGANPEQGKNDIRLFHKNQVIMGLLEPHLAENEIRQLAQNGVAAFALELLPRITRAQGMDVLSSMSTIGGYKAVLLAADMLPRMFPMLMTAAGTIAPARVLVIGAGVAGLQAIATARRLGATVQAYDIRPAAKEQVESLGARFVDLPLETAQSETSGGYARAMDEKFYQRQRELMTRVVAESDVVIATASVPGKKAPVLITAEMVRRMAMGSVIIDLAAAQGGNCELTQPDETTSLGGVKVIAPTNLASAVPHDASQMFARNIANFLLYLLKDGRLQLESPDEIISQTLVTRGGESKRDATVTATA